MLVLLIDSEKKLEVYEFLNEQKLGKKKKRLQSRRKERERKREGVKDGL